MTKGNRLCMDCHGTVISGEESEEVFDGVSCESCHGPASDYKKPHSADNPPNGYSVGRNFGMVLLEDVTARAEACAQCHYINDPGLISTGHPTGADFNIVEANQKINHWQAPMVSSAELKSAYEQVKAQRGVIPRVALLLFEKPPTGPTGLPEPTGPNKASQLPRPGPKTKGSRLPVFPVITDSTSVDEILLILKERLELLYQKTGRRK